MIIGRHVYAGLALALLGGARFAQAMGLGTSPPVVSTPAISPLNGGAAPAGATLLLQCTATDDGAVGALVAKVFAGSDPTASPLFTSGNLVGAAAATVTGSTGWTAPPAPASYTLVCEATDTGFPAATSSSSLAFSTAIATLPPSVSPVAGPTQVLVGSTSTFQVTASDPNTPPRPLTYTWSASAGTLTADPANPASVKWLAPPAAGASRLTVTVSNADASTATTASVTAVLATYQGQLPVPVVAPRRLCESDGGGLFVVDGDQGELGRVALLDPAGGVRGFATLPEPALALAYGAGFLWVTTARGSLYKVDARLGQTVGKVPLADGPFARPSGIAFDAANMALWVADTDARRVRVIRPDGTTVAVLDGAGGAPLAAPLDVAIEPTGGRAWLLVGTAKAALAPGEPAAAGRFVHAFVLGTRQYVGSYLPSGTGADQLTRAGGLTAARGRVYVSDIFQGTVQVLGPDGSLLGTVGAFGQGAGQLMNPMGLAGMANGDVAVANASLGRIDRFGDGAALPSCSGTVCLTSPDWQPIAAGPAQPGRGKGHPKGGKAHGDRDGERDGDDDGSGRRGGAPVVSATGPAQSPPGLVRLTAVATGGDCTFAWTQVGGPAVKLGAATTASPSFVARAVATYAFEVSARCGGSSATGRLSVAVQNRAPLADAGRVMVVRPGATVRLDASFSTDANGDRLTYSWDQTLGRPIAGARSGAALAATPQGPGLYAFQVTVSDGRGGEAVSEVPVLVASDGAPTAAAIARPADARAGATVLLDASGSAPRGRGAFAWRQVAGPEVSLADAQAAVASFVPPVAGRYRFEVSVADGPLRSPPAEVDVFVAPEGGELPAVAVTAPPEVVAVGAPVSLDAQASAAAPQYAWRQVAGPAAGLTGDDAPSATAVPFAPGFYVFEVAVRDGDAESRPARVAFEARAGGQAIPKAVASAPRTTAAVGELVFLDGRGSAGAASWRWTQVAGPWVVLGAQAAVTHFRPLEPGLYAFELEVDDGAVRSAPARVEVEVTRGEE
jgi:hypothetical protein